MTNENPLIASWRSIPPIARDLIVAALVILVLLGSLWTYTGQPIGSAPLVVVESGSMMHDDAPYGRFGTIDPGDLILVRNVDEEEARDRVVTKYGARSNGEGRPGEGPREAYGHPGDVIIFSQDECGRGEGRPPIIHRAMTWVEVHGDGTFSYHDPDGQWQERQRGVDLPHVNLPADAPSGWVTKGDNNADVDQRSICDDQLIQPAWLVGQARGEIPWLGLLKFMATGNTVDPHPGWCTVMRAHAPCDLFTMLWVTLGVLIAIPLAWDLSARFLRRDDDEGDGEGGGGGDDEMGPGQDSGPRVHRGPTTGPPPQQDSDEDDGIRRY